MATATQQIPARAWLCVICGMIINLHLSCLYAFSVWMSELAKQKLLTYGDSAPIFGLFCLLFALSVILGGWLTDRVGPRWTATVGGAVMGLGLVFAGFTLNTAPYLALFGGFGIVASIGMGLAFGATVPAALKWCGSRWAGLIAGMVVCTYGFAALFTAPLVKSLVSGTGLKGSFIILGLYYGAVVVVAGLGLVQPESGYAPPPGPRGTRPRDWRVGEALASPQFYLLFFLFMIGVMVGLTFIGKLSGVVSKGFRGMSGMIWVLPLMGGMVNGISRLFTGVVSDLTGRHWPLIILYAGAAISAFLAAIFLNSGSLTLLMFFWIAGYFLYGSLFSLFPAMTVDFFGTRHLGTIYGLIFFGGFGLGMILSKVGSLMVVGFLATGGVGLAVLSMVLMKRRPLKVQAETSAWTPVPSLPEMGVVYMESEVRANAAEETRVSLKANKKIVSENSCSVCNEKFSFGEDIWKCATCDQYYHQKCWEDQGGCNQPGCQAETKPCPLCGEEIKKDAMKCRFCGEYVEAELRDKTQPKGPLKAASEALTMALIGIVCFGFVLGPWAIVKGIKALNIIQREPGYEGKGKAIAAVIIGGVVILLNIVGFIGMVSRR